MHPLMLDEILHLNASTRLHLEHLTQQTLATLRQPFRLRVTARLQRISLALVYVHHLTVIFWYNA